MNSISASIWRATTERKSRMLDDSEVADAQRVQARLQAKLSAIAADRELTARARDRQRACAILDARAAMRAPRERSDAREQQEFSKAYREASSLDQSHSAEDRQLRVELTAADIGPGEAQLAEVGNESSMPDPGDPGPGIRHRAQGRGRPGHHCPFGINHD
jgi:hypothetical protein